MTRPARKPMALAFRLILSRRADEDSEKTRSASPPRDTGHREREPKPDAGGPWILHPRKHRGDEEP